MTMHILAILSASGFAFPAIKRFYHCRTDDCGDGGLVVTNNLLSQAGQPLYAMNGSTILVQ